MPRWNRSPRWTPQEQAVWASFMRGEPIPHQEPVVTVVPVRQPKTGATSNYRKGLAVEGVYGGKGCTSLLRKAGYHVTRSQDSQGAFDVIGIKASDQPGPPVRAVQVKRSQEFQPSGLNKGVREILTVPPGRGVSRERWLWVDNEGWVAKVRLTQANEPVVTGSRAEPVFQSLMRNVFKVQE